MGDDDQVFRAGHLHVPLHLFFFLFGGGGLGFRASCAPPFRAVVFFLNSGHVPFQAGVWDSLRLHVLLFRA